MELVKQRYQRYGLTYKLIIMDLYMPICNGFVASLLIRNFLKDNGIRSDSEDSPYICVLTSNNLLDCRSQALKMGINDVEFKPIFKEGV